MNCIIKRYSSHGKITFDDYVACCVKLKSLTGKSDPLTGNSSSSNTSFIPD